MRNRGPVGQALRLPRVIGYLNRWAGRPPTAAGTAALLCTGHGFFDCLSELPNRPIDLLGGGDRGWGDQQVVTGDAIDAPLNGIDEQSALEGCTGHSSRKIHLRSERFLALLV